jgi:hypothetical protein
METSGSSETSVRIYRSTWLHTSYDRGFCTSHRDVIKSHTVINITEKLIWIKLDQDEFQWWVFVNTVKIQATE